MGLDLGVFQSLNEELGKKYVNQKKTTWVLALLVSYIKDNF